MHFTGFGIRCNGRISLTFNQILDLLCYLTLTDPADLHHLGYNDLRLVFLQIRDNILLEHGLQFIGRARKKNRGFSFFLKDQSRSSSVMIVKNNGSLRDHGLFIVVLRDTSLRIVFLIFLQIFIDQFP